MKKLISLFIFLFNILYISANTNKQRILLVHLAPWLGGDGVHTVNLYKMLREKNYHVSILVLSKGPLSKHLYDQNLPFHHTKVSLLTENTKNISSIAKLIKSICIQENISLIHCNHLTEVPAILEASKILPVTTVFTYHLPYTFKTEQLHGLSSVICVDERFSEYLNKENKEKKIGISHIAYIPPLYDAQKFISYMPTCTKKEFFKKTYGIILEPWPIICMIGNMYINLKHKNYPLLLEAIHELIFKRNKKIQVMIAGDGPTRKIIAKIAKKLGVYQYIHFLGFTDKIPDLLHHSDVFVLTSQQEAFGIAFLEAALMKKVAIGARNTGAESIIKHEETGFLFNNNDVTDLVFQIEKALDNSTVTQQLGINAFAHVTKIFLPQLIFNKLESLYCNILN